ncbi:hypothetical protein, partial [Fischerella thermalis]|uniref:hypothetical protein n=1 Tax=Fischerella thermalis TaxID=372787 RepID=UPI001CA47517
CFIGVLEEPSSTGCRRKALKDAIAWYHHYHYSDSLYGYSSSDIKSRHRSPDGRTVLSAMSK